MVTHVQHPRLASYLRQPQVFGANERRDRPPIRVLADKLGLSLPRAKEFVDRAVFERKVVRILVKSRAQAANTVNALHAGAAGVLGAWVEPQQRVDDLMLVMPSKVDSERDAVAEAWELSGGSVTRLDRFWAPPTLPRARVRLYGPDTFALVVAEKLSVTLTEPDPYLVIKCPGDLLKRTVTVERLGDAKTLSYPCFVKPVIPKQFRARVFATPDELLDETRGLEGSCELLRSSVVELLAEARGFVLDGVIRAFALYEGTGDRNRVAKTCERVALALDLPRACVVDVGLLADGSWVFIEANAAWGAGLNGCDPHDVLECIAAATVVP